ncbi:MAG: hypothetical protein ABTQ34_09580 [Bdellovibrionales bacterium]
MNDDSNVIPPSMRRIAPYIALIFAVFIAYVNIYDNAFLFDDDLLITMNRYLRDWSSFDKLFTATSTEGAGIIGGFFRPVQNLLYFFVYQAGGPNPLGFHLLNVALHAANACLAFKLSKKLGFSPAPALLALLLWAVHPLHTEAITYMSGTADPLFVLFMLAALVYLAPDFKPFKIWLSLPLFFLALMAKENALVFPALVMICMFLTLPNRKFHPRSYLKTIPLWLLALAYLYWRYTADHLDGPTRYARLFQLEDFSNWSLYAQHPLWRIQTFLATLPNYLYLIVWPHDLHIERSFAVFASWKYPVVGAGAAVLVLALAQLGWGRGKRGLALSWGLLWFAAAHFPNTGLFIPMNSLFLEHWMYLPTLGLFLGIGETLGRSLEAKNWNKAKYALACCALIGCAALGAKTLEQNAVWYSPFTLYPHIFANGERSPRGHNNLALAYQKNHQLPESIAELRKAIKEGDTYAETHHNLALALLSLPDGNARKEEAIKELLRALEIEPKFYRSRLTLSQVYASMGKDQESAEELQKAKDILQQIERNK